MLSYPENPLKAIKRQFPLVYITLLAAALTGCGTGTKRDIETGTKLFGPQTFEITSGGSQLFSNEIRIPDPEDYEGPFLVMVENGDENGEQRVVTGSVMINDEVIFKYADFQEGKGPLSREMDLTGTAKLEVMLTGEPGDRIRVTVIGWLKPDLLVDIDGNIYRTIKIGGQVWMAENLKVTRFSDGSPIPHETNGAAWYKLETPAYCYYNNDSAAYSETFGTLYNFHAINSGKLAPEGWRIPTDEDFRRLVKFLDPDADFVKHEASLTAGGKLKETGTLQWADPNTGATNALGFTALPGGCRSYAGNFSMLGTFGYFGSSTNESTIALRFATGSLFMRDGISEYVGVSVRCVKEE